MLEPNVKEGKGGLRDLQTLYWIGKYLHRVPAAAGLVGDGPVPPRGIRHLPHRPRISSGPCAATCTTSPDAPTITLTFDMQVEVAARMGYRDTGGRRAVEHFMQDYFRHATRVGELTRIFLTELEARHAKREASLFGIFKRTKRVKPGFKLVQGRIDVDRPGSLPVRQAEPSARLRRGAAHRLSAAPQRDAPDRRQP